MMTALRASRRRLRALREAASGAKTLGRFVGDNEAAPSRTAVR